MFGLQFYKASLDTIGLASHTCTAVESAILVIIHQSDQTNHHQHRSSRAKRNEQQARKLTFRLKVHTQSTVDADTVEEITDTGLETPTLNLARDR